MAEELDANQALKDAENSLRDFIAASLERKFGNDWVDQCGVTEDRIAKWRERKQVEQKKSGPVAPEERLIYYADFYDLPVIIRKNWDWLFKDVFGDLKETELLLAQLARFRDPEAHRRELMPHQKHLVLGIAGEIRAQITSYRSRQETSHDYYPRIESVRSDIGDSWVFGGPDGVSTGKKLRVGDKVTFVVAASDPLGEPLHYQMTVIGGRHVEKGDWQPSNALEYEVTTADVGRQFTFDFSIRSSREYHARGDDDDRVHFFYEVLPPTDRA